MDSWKRRPLAMTAHRLSRLHRQLHRPAEALRWASEAFRLHPDHSMIATGYAEVLHEQARYGEAKAVLRYVLKRNKCYGPALAMLRELNDRDQ